MDVKLLTQTWIHNRTAQPHRAGPYRSGSPVKLASPVRTMVRATTTTNGSSQLVTVPGDATTGPGPTVYDDNWFDRMAIDYLSRAVQSVSGLRNDKTGFEGLMEATSQVSKAFNPIQQRELVARVLEEALPKPILTLIRTMLPNSKFTREYFAVFTTLFCAWLMGPCEVKESELNGTREKNVVHVKKCRILEQSNCVGICVNMCKIPSQTFIKDSFGIPVNMVPNFDDMSCEMIFGQDPPSPNNDPALSQPCYKLCKAKQKHTVNCSG